MEAVEQRQLWRPDDHPDGAQRGDCARACIASLFEVSYEQTDSIDGNYQTLADWTRARFPGIGCLTQVLTDLTQPEHLDSWRAWPESHFESGYWMATVYSQRIPDREEFGCGCADRTEGKGDPSCGWCGGKPGTRSMGIFWGLHAVVMRGGACVWDPHPERVADTPGTYRVGPFRAATTWRVVDPAQLRAQEAE